MSSFAAILWQNQLFRKICYDLKIDEREETEILKFETELIRGLRKKLVSSRFD